MTREWNSDAKNVYCSCKSVEDEMFRVLKIGTYVLAGNPSGERGILGYCIFESPFRWNFICGHFFSPSRDIE